MMTRQYSHHADVNLQVNPLAFRPIHSRLELFVRGKHYALGPILQTSLHLINQVRRSIQSTDDDDE